MALHVRHKVPHRVQGRICLSFATVVLCATFFIPTNNISVTVQKNNKASAICILPQAEQPQKQATQAPRIEPSIQLFSEPEPVCIINIPPILPESEAPYTPLVSTMSVDIEENACEHLFYTELTPEFEEAIPQPPRTTSPQATLTYTPPQYAATPQPPYPKELLRRRVSGSVRVRIHINPQGAPTAVEIISSTHPAFTQAAKQTILKGWRFHPAHNGTTTVAATVVTTVQFVI